MKVGELCAGYGGISIGLRLAGEDTDLRWLAESDPALEPLHPAGVSNLGDIATVDWSQVEPVDLLTAGFPCQPVSAAGAQLAEADPRWLWPEVKRAVEALRPGDQSHRDRFNHHAPRRPGVRGPTRRRHGPDRGRDRDRDRRPRLAQ